MDVKTTLLKFVSTDLLNNTVEVESDDDLLADSMVSSLGMLQLVTFIEETYEIKIPFEDLIIENFRTVGVICDYLRTQIGEKNF